MAERIAIITGASSGLGKEFTKLIDREKEVDEIWIIARREERLKALAEECRKPVKCLPLDLTDKASVRELKKSLTKANPQVRYLINCAGYGRIGSWKDVSVEDCENLIDLNCRAAVAITQTILPFAGKGTKILEICSTAAFQPFQRLNVYAASKAFLYRYSRALRFELLGKGISVTAVCPYWIKDTEFIGTAGKETTGASDIKHFPFASKQKSVAKLALQHAKLGLPVSTPGVMCSIHRVLAKFIPSEIMMWFWELLRRI